MQEKKSISSIKIFLLLLTICSSTFCGYIALSGRPPHGIDFDELINSLWRDGHRPVGYISSFLDPSGYDVYFYIPDEELSDDTIATLENFVKTGGHLILITDCRSYCTDATNRIFEYEAWFEELGRPQIYDEYVLDSIPDTLVELDHGSFWESSFIINFDNRWKRASGIDTIITGTGVSAGLEGVGHLNIVGLGGRDSYGHPYVADTAVYDSFAVQMLAGFYYAGEISVISDANIFSGFPYSGWTDIITLYDNLQFARQLFACNTRADSAGIEQADSTFRVHLHGDFTDFNPDSCEWKFRILHVWPPYQFRGHELGARYIAPDILEIDKPPIYNPVYDTVEVCLMFLPDYDGETVLWDFPVCDTFKFDFSNIAETPTPQAFTISAYPNPFNSSITISIDYGSESAEQLSTIEIFDVNGRKIKYIPPASFVRKNTANNTETSFVWVPDESISSGIYLIRVETKNNVQAGKIVYLK